jgi:hypothetical protein
MKYGSAYWQCETYRQLVNAGYMVVPEFRIGCLVADLAVMYDNKVAFLIEAKSAGSSFGWRNHRSKQWEKYYASGYPFWLVQDEFSLERLMRTVAVQFPIEQRSQPCGTEEAGQVGAGNPIKYIIGGKKSI